MGAGGRGRSDSRLQEGTETIRAVVFDLDGVLADTNGYHADSLRLALREVGYPAYVPTNFSTQRVMDAAGVPSELRKEIVRRRWRHALRLMYRYAGPNIVTRFCLAGLRIDGYPILVASSSTDEFVAGVLWKTGIAKYVDGVLTRDMVAKVKPDPEIYQKALTSLRMTGNEVLAVEDGATGIAAATAAGCHVMAVHGQMGVSYETVTQRIRDIEGERC